MRKFLSISLFLITEGKKETEIFQKFCSVFLSFFGCKKSAKINLMQARTQNSPPTVPTDWIGGHFRSFRKNPTDFLTKLSRLGDVSAFRIGKIPAFLINHPDLIRDLLITNNHKFIKGRALQRAKTLLGDGLLTSEGEFHLRQRRMIQPVFHRAKINEYAEAMIEYGEKMSNEWRDGEVRDIDKEMMRLTLWIVGKTLFSANVEDEADEVGRAMTTIVSAFDFLILPFSEYLEKLPLPPLRKVRKARETLDEIIYKIINERRKSKEDKGDLLSMLLLAQDEETGGTMTDQQVRDECLTLFLAGHETTANALTWTFYLLSQHPQVEQKFHAELEEIIAGRPVTPEDYGKLKYTEAVLAESMRLYPPAWTMGRLAIKEHEFNGFRIAPKSLILASQYVMHRDSRFWENAEDFQPERWEKQSIKEAGNKFIYFPFSKGVRSCIGEGFAWMEGVLLLAILGRSWRLNLLPGQRIGLRAMITLRPKYGMKMQLQKR
jgi:cytochrome P450